jgi:large subunit ribosomal protein L1
MKHGKGYQKVAEIYAPCKGETIEEVVKAVKQGSTARETKFDETVEVAARLNVDPRQSDQMVRGTVVLPHGTGKKVRVVVVGKGEKLKEAEASGADTVGSEDVIEKIKGGWLDFDAMVATPDMMGEVGKLGKLLGPRGLMPNPKSGTVTFDVTKAVRDLKAGKIEFRVDKGGNVHAPVGKASFEDGMLSENIRTFLAELVRLRPASAKGGYIKSLTVSTTMGPGIKLDVPAVTAALKG